MTEERKFCRICKNLGIDCEAGTFYCSLSHRPDKLPNTLKCDEFILCDFITRLEQENEKLKKSIEYDSRINDMQAEIDCGDRLIGNYRKALEEIRKLAVTGSEQEDCYSCEEIVWKIDEVLNDNQAN